eukprot:PITA_29075
MNIEIILGDNATYLVKGIETVILHLNQGQTLHSQEVLYVPYLKKNVVSISAMEDKGFKVTFIDGKVVFGKATQEMHSLLDLGLKVPIREVEISHDVTFDEDSTLRKVRDLLIPRKDNNDDDPGKKDEPLSDDPMPDAEDLMDPIDPPPSDLCTSRKRPVWLKDTLQDVEKHIALRGKFHESKKPNRDQGYLASMSTIVQSKPCTFEESMKHQVWTDAMNEEYESIMKNDVCDVLPRPKDKSVVTSKWLYKIKHGANGSTEKFKARFVTRGFSQKEGVDYDEIFALVAQYNTIHSIIALVAS